VIDLRDDDDNALEEKKLVETAGMRFLNFPLGNWDRPEVKDIDIILAQINTAENQPVFVHCKRGSDRTGTVIAVYRMSHDDWDAKKAGNEAEEFGIGWWQHGMRDFINDYYRDHVGKK
jgi:protein tyrosine/serine phosphatase